MKQEDKKKKKHNWIPITFFLVMLFGYIGLTYDPEAIAREIEYDRLLTPTPFPTETPTPIGWVKPTATPKPTKAPSANDIIMKNVGLVDYVEINAAYYGDSKTLSAQTDDCYDRYFTVCYENGNIESIYMLNAAKEIWLYSRSNGGYLAKYNKHTGEVTHYESGGVIEDWK